MNTTKLVSIFLVVGSAALAVGVFALEAGSSPRPGKAAFEPALALEPNGVSTRALQTTPAASLNAQEVALAMAGGMEMGSAGFHLLFPSDTPDPHIKNADLFPWPGEYTVRGWGYWQLQPRYALPYHASDVAVNQASWRVNVSFATVLPRSLLSYGSSLDPVSGLHTVSGFADSASLIALRRILGPKRVSGGITTDWYGISRPTGSVETSMRVVVVADDVAYLPVDISGAVSDFSQGLTTSCTFLLATGLSDNEAAKMLENLSN